MNSGPDDTSVGQDEAGETETTVRKRKRRAGYTKNHGQRASKVRRKMVRASRRRNRRT